MKNYRRLALLLTAPILVFTSSQAGVNQIASSMSDNLSTTSEMVTTIPDALKKQAVQTLREVMKTQAEWVKVHAAEFLIWSGNADGVKEEFLKEEKLFGEKSQYRIGIARVLAQTAKTKAEKQVYTDKILRAFLDVNGSDRIHAVETLGKLKISPIKENAEVTQDALKSTTESLALYTHWSVAFTSPDSFKQTKTEMLELLKAGKSSPAAAGTAAYILRNLGGLTKVEWKVLADATLASKEPNVYLYSAAWVTVPKEVSNSTEVKKIRERLLQFRNSKSKGDRMELCMALSIKGTKVDLPLLTALLNGEDPLPTDSETADVKAAAAYAILMNME
jgi:hypothetical protein